MRVRVIATKFGAYKEGEEIEMHESTAKAVAKNGKVEIITEGEEIEPKKKGKKQ